MAWSAVDGVHVPFVVAFAGSRSEVVQPFDLLGAELDAVGSSVLLDADDSPGARNRGDVVSLDEQPGQSDLCRCGTNLGRDGSDLIDNAQIGLEILSGEAWVLLAPVVVGKVFDGADLAGEEAVSERGVRNKADAQLAQQRKQLGLWVAGPQGVLRLQRCDLVHGVRAADRGGAGLGQADVADLATGDNKPCHGCQACKSKGNHDERLSASGVNFFR